jgi:hypothetical protein
MTTSQEEVLQKVASGELSADQANSLLAAMPPKRSRLRALLNPLDAMTIGQALLLGAIAGAGGIALGATGVQFDGALDMHLTPHVPALTTRLLQLAVSWPMTALVFWLGTRVLRRPARAIDFLAAVGVARVPSVLGAGVTVLLPVPRAEAEAMRWVHEHPVQLALLVIVSMPFLAWQVVALHNGVKTAAGLSGKRFTTAFALLLVAAEFASKLVLHAVR